MCTSLIIIRGQQESDEWKSQTWRRCMAGSKHIIITITKGGGKQWTAIMGTKVCLTNAACTPDMMGSIVGQAG